MFNIVNKIFEEIISSVILVLLIELIFYKLVSLINILHLITFFLICYIYSHGIDFEDHGYYNLVAFTSLTFIIIIFISPLNCLIYIIKSNNKLYIFLFTFGLIFILSAYIFLSNNYMNCNDWENGLNQTSIDNDKFKYGCKIIFPKTCSYKIGKYLFDKTKKDKNICNEKEDTKKKLIKNSENKYINSKTMRVAYPLPNKIKKIHMAISLKSEGVLDFYRNNLIDLDNPSLVENILKNNTPEIIIDYNRNPLGKLNINLQFNKTLSEERKLYENNSSPYSENIIVIFIDSVSRAYSIRSLKKTLSFFEKFMKYKGTSDLKSQKGNFHSFQFFKFHSFGHYTRYNYPQVFYGRVRGKLVRNIKYLKENGYVTCYVNDMCHIEPTNTGHNMTNDEITDHEFLICDPNMKHIFSTSKRCLYNKITASYAFEYGDQFWRKYKDNRRYLSINLEDGHEGTLEVLKYTDEFIYNFLKNLYEDNLLKSTSVFLISDHGCHSPSPYYVSDFYHIERFLPMFYLLCNDRKSLSYSEQYRNMNNNQQILVTGYDIYNTIANLVFGDKYDLIPNKTEKIESPKSKLGISLFNKIDPIKRTPKLFPNMTNKVCI